MSRRRTEKERDPRARAADVGADGVSVFTRTQAARFLTLRIEAIKRAEERGALRYVELGGIRCFLREELERYRAQTRHGQIASRVFGSFRAGLSPAEVVVEQELTPELVLQLLESYARLSDSIICAAPKGQRALWEAAFGIKLSPAIVLRALELAARTPSIRERLVGT